MGAAFSRIRTGSGKSRGKGVRALVGWLARHEAALLDTIARALA